MREPAQTRANSSNPSAPVPLVLQRPPRICRRQEFTSFALRGIVLQELVDCFLQVLLLFLRLGLRIKGLTGQASPHQVVVGGIVHIQRQLALVDRGSLAGGSAHSSRGPIPSTT